MLNLWGIQQSVFSALTSAPATYAVYDAVPQGVAKPYIVIGEYTEEPDEDLQIVTADATLMIHTWSQTAGKKQTHDMLDFVRGRLDNQLLPGSWYSAEEFVEIMEDVGSTATVRLYHGIARYRIRVDDGAVIPPLGQFDVEQFA